MDDLSSRLNTELLVESAPDEHDQILREIIVREILSHRRSTTLHRTSTQGLPALTDNDILAFAAPQRVNPTRARLQRISTRLDRLTDSLLQYFPARETCDPTISKELLLLENVQHLLDNVRDKHNESLALLERPRLATDTESPSAFQAQAELNQALNQVMIAIPPHRHKLTAARCDYFSAMIESSLVKISLLRARAHRSIYGATSQTWNGPEHEATLASALSIAYRKLKTDEARMREEEKELDRQLEEYQVLLSMVDGGSSGGFQQIVNDWTRVNKETEECRRDLRRLGWTGD
ncbi:hypothetical protein NP233_g3134 [Leucocoprinus birnbaumii]|uniref:Uncharacterized protein n=1 Tax=Leucocoprinus birnbaumii TaxID=56174 RepID=A0AAD5VYI8_9AGAR|nr:hypothetical protein NP233_g3134 [Leucocoprinus birnbaumii]